MEENNERFQKIINDLENISPLALPEYLEKCEFYDMKDSIDILNKAVKDFENEGGVSSNLVETVFTGVGNSILLILTKKFHEDTHKKLVKGKINTASIIKNMLNFEYPNSIELNYDNATNGFTHDQLRRDISDIDKEYNQKNYRDLTGKRNSDFKNSAFSDSESVKDVTGRDVYKEGVPRDKIGEADHIKPLQKIHNEGEVFIRRYCDEDSIKEIVNDDENFQLLAGTINASKGGAKSNSEFIKYTEDIEKAGEIYHKPESERTNDEVEFLKNKNKNITSTQRTAAKLIAKEKSGEVLTDEEKRVLDKYHLSEKAKTNLNEKQKSSEKMLQKEFLKQGSKTVFIEQIGKILEVLVGPLSFEIKDSIKNGVMFGLDCNDKVEAFGKRIARAFKYIAEQLPKLIGDLLGDLAQMLGTLLLTLVKVIRDFFGSFVEIIVSGFSIIIDSIKILSNKNMSSAQKGDAIIKLLVGFTTNVLGAFIIDKLLNYLAVPPPFSEVLAVLISSLLSALAVYALDKLDLFALKDEQRYQFVKNIFEEKCKNIKADTAKFDIKITEYLKQKKIDHAKQMINMNKAIHDGDLDQINQEIDKIVDELKIDIPYSNIDDFVDFVRKNESIYIGA